MDKVDKLILWIGEIGKEDIALVGGKGANLGEMIGFDIPVPRAFAVTAKAYSQFLTESRLEDKIPELLGTVNHNDGKELKEKSAEIREAINRAQMPPSIEKEIREAYRRLGKGLVAVRSSATAEDLPDASFAGQQSTYLNIEGEDEVVAAVQRCWASLFEGRAVFYRAERGFDQLRVRIAVVVQRMVQSEISGVMFTAEPLTGSSDRLEIEAICGLGEAIVSGEVTPDLYVVDKATLQILEKKVNRQEWKLERKPFQAGDRRDENNIRVSLSAEEGSQQKLTDAQIIALAKVGKRIEGFYQLPQDIEWAIDQGNIFVVQSRPITTTKAMKEREEGEAIEATPLLSGVAACPGMASGPVNIVTDSSNIDQVKKGDILVARITTPDFVPAMKRAVAIITDSGGRTAHAAIVSRELGIPCIVGTGNATKILRNGQVVTVDGARGKVYEGALCIAAAAKPEEPAVRIKTRTRVYVNLAEPELAETVASRDVDGVGLLRAEFIIAHIGEHPRHIIHQKREREFVGRLAEGVEAFARAFEPRPVVYRTTDFKTNEYRNLKGGQDYEDLEENPMLGYRGCSRYVTELDVFKLEIEAIKQVRQRYKNLWVMIPFVRTVSEIVKTRQFLMSEGLKQSEDFRLWMMVEVPSNVFLLDKFIDAGIDGVSIGSNDLTQLILGLDRDNPKLADTFDEMNEAVLLAIEQVVTSAARRGITCSICGQAPSFYPALTEKLVEWGITSVSVTPDMIGKTRQVIAEAERRLGLLP